jgi:hypothetical protein
MTIPDQVEELFAHVDQIRALINEIWRKKCC